MDKTAHGAADTTVRCLTRFSDARPQGHEKSCPLSRRRHGSQPNGQAPSHMVSISVKEACGR